jgi:hypothetical protein
MTKKERLKLRREYAEIKSLKAEDLAAKILDAPVVNPILVSENTSAEESESETADA